MNIWLLFPISRLTFATFILSWGLSCWASSPNGVRVLTLVEIVPSETAEYFVSKEFEQARLATQLAIQDYRKMMPGCAVQLDSVLRRGSEEDLFLTIQGLSRKTNPGVVVGLSRSNSIKLAAKAAQGTPLVGISIGASTSSLYEINPLFVSLMTSWEDQWALLKDEMISRGCSRETSIGIFDPGNALSVSYKNQFVAAFGATVLSNRGEGAIDFSLHLRAKKCLFIPLSYSSSEKILQRIVSGRWSGTIIGIGGWSVYPSLIKKTLNRASHIQVVMPTVWNSKNLRAKEFEDRVRKILGRDPSLFAPFTYDAVLLGLDTLCSGTKPWLFNPQGLKRLSLLRSYSGIAQTGNYQSELRLVTLGNHP